MIECEKVVVLGMYKKCCGKVSSKMNSLRFQTKVGKLATLPLTFVAIFKHIVMTN